MQVAETVSTDEKSSKPWQFKPGNNANPKGRPKGSRNKLGEAFIEALHADFEQHGPKVIEKCRIEKPDAYLKVIASILPKELNVNTSALGEMSDDELAAVFASLRALADTYTAQIAGAGNPEASGPQSPALLSPLQ
jgi:hypothetical protein